MDENKKEPEDKNEVEDLEVKLLDKNLTNEEKMSEISKFLEKAQTNKISVKKNAMLSPFMFKSKIASVLILFVINFIICFSLAGYLEVLISKGLLMIFLFNFLITGLELAIKLGFSELLPKFYFKRFIFINFVITSTTIFGIALVGFYDAFFNNIGNILYFILAFLIIRQPLVFYAKKYYYHFRIKKRFTGEKK